LLRRSDIIAALEDARSTLKRLENMLEEFDRGPSGQDQSAYKKDNGRLSEYGVRELNRMISNGKTDSEIARILGITPAAVARYR
jgi:hypothetical protein